ncbi:MAG: TraB/GumN family protein [Hyphomicrobiaceae bacterium]|nr:TraB/GumN family protein [Hyphomicrobiaceae bacterium]
MRMFRHFLMLSLLIVAGSASAYAEAGVCKGVDMLSELATSDPAALEDLRKQAAALENTQALFWKIEKAGAPPSYLFGTMHLSDTRITTLSPAVSDAFTHAKVLALEVGDLSPGALMAAMTTSKADLIYTDGTSLAQKLSKDEFEKVKTVVASSGMPVQFADLMKPWLVGSLLAVSDCERRQVASGVKVLDMQLADKAKAASIPVTGLESIEQQLTAMSSVPENEQIQMLRVSLKFADRSDDMMETVLQLYLKRDMGAAMPFQYVLAEKMGIPKSAFANFEKSLLVDRNARMETAAAPLIDKGGAFIAVGALHLSGKTGLVALLREAGYTVTPIE